MKENCSSRATGPVFLGHFWLERGVDGETQLPCFRETATRGKKIALADLLKAPRKPGKNDLPLNIGTFDRNFEF